jgi:hypothetical protein
VVVPPARILNVESSRRAVDRVDGRVPCHPLDESRGRVCCNLWLIKAGGMSGGTSDLSEDGLGRNDVKTISEFMIS